MLSSLTVTPNSLKGDLHSSGLSLNPYLKNCVVWLTKTFSKEILKLKIPDPVFLAKHRVDGIKGVRTILYIDSSHRNNRGIFANSILDKFSDGPLFVQKGKIDSSKLEFLWIAGKDKIQKQVSRSRLSEIDFGKETSDRLSLGGGSDGSRYSIGYYSFNESLDELKEILDKVKSFDGKIDIVEADSRTSEKRVEAKCILDLTVKEDVESAKKSQVADANFLLQSILSTALKTKTTTAYKKQYISVQAIDDRKTAMKKIGDSIDDSQDLNSLDKSIYAVLFNTVLNKGASDNFLMDILKKNKINSQQSFAEAIESQSTYGVVVSELLVPFLLLAGFKTIDGKEILKGISETEKVVSVEFPEKKNNVLTDYNVTFVNTDAGKRYAISAKWTDGHNSPGLFTLLCDNMKMFGKKVLEQYSADSGKDSVFAIAAKIVEEDDNKKGMPGKLLELSKELGKENERFVSKLAEQVTYKDLRDGKYKAGIQDKEEKQMLLRKLESEIGNVVKRKNNIFQQILDFYPYSIPIICDKKLAKDLNADKDFLLTLYAFVFGFYGKDVQFQQIQLNRDLSLKYIERQPEATIKNISDYIAINSISSIKKNAKKNNGKIFLSDVINIAQPLRVSLLK